MSGQHIIMQLLAKNNIILDQDSISMIENNNPDKEYNYYEYNKSKGFTLFHKLVLLSGANNKYPKMSDVIKEYMLLYPEEVNKVNEEGWSALLLAASYKLLNIVKLLLEHNANALRNINVKDNDGWTVLMHASYNATESSPKIVKLLLEHNANVNIRNNYGWTALMCASYDATESSLKIVKLLLSCVEQNADVNVKDNDGWTALMYAAHTATESSQKIVKLLLEHDLVPNEKELRVVKNIKILNEKN